MPNSCSPYRRDLLVLLPHLGPAIAGMEKAREFCAREVAPPVSRLALLLCKFLANLGVLRLVEAGSESPAAATAGTNQTSMNGLAAVIQLDGSPADPAAAGRMRSALVPFGPDGVDVFHAGPALMGFGKLATTVEQRDERQPWTSADRTLAVCFDGRIDNRAELLEWLRSRDPLPPTVPDSVLFAALFRLEGDACLPRLAGDYALACWDATRRRCFCARSPVGWRTLHWHQAHGRLSVATNPKILFAVSDLPRRINEGVVAEILAMRFVTTTETLWQGISVLPPGSALAADGGGVRTWQWLTGPFPSVDLPDDEAYGERFNALFDQSLRATLRSAGPVAAHLSGGLDSSSIVCRGIELHRQGRSAIAPEPISAVYPGEIQDESTWIEAVEQHTGQSTDRVRAAPYDWERAEQWTRDSLHLPLRPNVAGPIIATCERLHARGTRVLLTGEGGDEWFAGTFAYWPDWFARGRWLDLVRDVHHTFRGRSWFRSGLTALSNGAGPYLMPKRREDLLRPWLALTAPRPWVRPEWAARVGLRDRRPVEQPVPHLRGFAQTQRGLRLVFSRSYVSYDNVIAYAASRRIEMRHPFHDRRLTAFALGVPGDQLRRHGNRKHVLRQAMRGTLPEIVRDRRTKAAFVTPILDGIVERMRHRPLSSLLPVRNGWIDGKELDAIVREHVIWAQKPSGSALPQGHLGAVWMALSLDLWLRATA